MRRDDRDDPFDDFFREIERMMNEMMGGPFEADFDAHFESDAGFGSDTHVDVHEHAEELRVIADMPGVAKDDISLKCDGEALTISAQTETRSYDERISLPARVDEHSASATFNNGVLEVVLERSGDSANIDVN